MTDIIDQLKRLKILPVIVIDDPANAVPLGQSLLDGGLPCAEVTFRTAAGVESLRRMAEAHPNLLVGAGTVLSAEKAADARRAGAKFIVSPGFNPRVVEYCIEHKLPVFPGIATPTEIEMALAKNLTTVKFFPAEPMGGLKFLKAIAAPYNMMHFMPTGGVTAEIAKSYLAFNRVIACGGSWMAPAEWIAAKRFEDIRAETRKAVDAVSS
jgi:2-dehydro-3-deoxyphosphogluconate aldolase / (4S)-4-hydroxy-2-oxoglutarate aldolase